MLARLELLEALEKLVDAAIRGARPPPVFLPFPSEARCPICSRGRSTPSQTPSPAHCIFLSNMLCIFAQKSSPDAAALDTGAGGARHALSLNATSTFSWHACRGDNSRYHAPASKAEFFSGSSPMRHSANESGPELNPSGSATSHGLPRMAIDQENSTQRLAPPNAPPTRDRTAKSGRVALAWPGKFSSPTPPCTGNRFAAS